MSWFTRIAKTERTYDGSFAGKGKGAPPPHVRDKNKSHSAQGANASIPDQEGDLGQQQDDGDESAGSEENQLEQQDTTSQ